jgi:TetR/AcrR family transcriptional regulator, repressor for uid operon
MNVYSFWNSMTQPLPATAVPLRSEARKQAILDAAALVFTAKGFELATMQDVAAACGMSPGNLYRYFGGKGELIAGLVERDRSEMAKRFAELANAPNQLVGFETLGRVYLMQEAKTAKLTVTIWAASIRSPELALPCATIEEGVTQDLFAFLTRVREQGFMALDVDPALVAHLIMALVQSFLRDAALKPDHNAARDLDILFATVRAALAGHIKLETNSNREASHAA